MTPDANDLWRALKRWAASWNLAPPRVSAMWIDRPPSWRRLARGGWIERPLCEPPAILEHLGAVETRTGLKVPDDLCRLHAVHDGSFAPLLPFGMSLLSYEAMLTTWRTLAQLADMFPEGPDEVVAPGTHRPSIYHRAWLPVASTDETHLLLDFAPGLTGTPGQVLLQEETTDFVGVVVARTMTEFLVRWLALLERGDVAFDAARGHAVPTSDASIDELLRGCGGLC